MLDEVKKSLIGSQSENPALTGYELTALVKKYQRKKNTEEQLDKQIKVLISLNIRVHQSFPFLVVHPTISLNIPINLSTI